jgi:hypothetical protein
VTVLPWPPRSPDLNPIENLWATLKRRVGANGNVPREELAKKVMEEWDNIPQEEVDRVVADFPRRVAEVIANEGRHTAH